MNPGELWRALKHRPALWLLRHASPELLGWLLLIKPHWRAHLAAGTDILVRNYLGRYRVMVNNTFPIEREMLSGIYDPGTVAIIHALVRSGDVCVDVGANVGALTLAFAEAVGPQGKVYAIEPGPPTYARLETNVGLNSELATRVSLHRVGFADESRTLQWAEDENNRGNAGLLGSSGIDVPVMCLDRFCDLEGITRLDFLKIDVEGMECEVFKGAVATLRRSQPLIYFETLAAFADFRGFDIFGKIEATLDSAGYSLFKLSGSKATRTSSADLDSNTLAVPKNVFRGREPGNGGFDLAEIDALRRE